MLELETIVFDFIQDYLNDSRPFSFESLVPVLQNRLSRTSVDLNNEGLRQILLSLVKKKLIVEGSVLSRETILNNSSRKRIYEYIIENNGVLFSQISNIP